MLVVNTEVTYWINEEKFFILNESASNDHFFAINRL